jgi:uncharacterized protein (DUF779 family)
MSATLRVLDRPAAPAPLEVRATPRALQLLERLRLEAGGVALLVAPEVTDEVLCLGRRDFVLGPNDVKIATVRGCPIYVDRRASSFRSLRTMVLDAETDALGDRFLVRVSGEER